MSDVKHIDYVGFTFGDKHSSQLGIVRTSEGSRFNENLLPTLQDKTIQVPGGDGTYLFGSFYTQKSINISFAFDSLTEQQLNELKTWLGDKKIRNLILDEAPYKAYHAKITGSATIKHIPFAEGATNRTYKGEGSIQFTAYDPYAYSVHKYLNEYNCFNIEEWRDAADLLEQQYDYDKISDTNKIKLYNPGIKETDFVLSFSFNGANIPEGKIYILNNGKTVGQLSLREISPQGSDDEIRINSKLNLIEGYREGVKSGNIYNKAIKAGTFFKIPVSKNMEIILPQYEHFKDIQYNYIYF